MFPGEIKQRDVAKVFLTSARHFSSSAWHKDRIVLYYEFLRKILDYYC